MSALGVTARQAFLPCYNPAEGDKVQGSLTLVMYLSHIHPDPVTPPTRPGCSSVNPTGLDASDCLAFNLVGPRPSSATIERVNMSLFLGEIDMVVSCYA